MLIVPQGLRKKKISREFLNYFSVCEKNVFFFFDTLKKTKNFLIFPSGLQYFINMTFNLINIC